MKNKTKITFIGTGSAFAHNYGNNSAFLEFNGTNLLIDCGGDTVKRFEENIGPISKVSNIFITHCHGDHCSGLEEVAFKNKFMYDNKANLICSNETFKDLKVYLESTLKWNDDSTELLTVEDYFNIFTFKYDFSVKNYEFKIKKTRHVGLMPAYSIYTDKFIYTGDTQFYDWDFVEDEIRLGDRIIFQDTQLASFGKDVHATLPKLLEQPEYIRKKIYCMHYGNDIEDYRSEIENAGMHIVEPFKPIIL
jgi:ribonuclease BN (tRNA processing enzyme)